MKWTLLLSVFAAGAIAHGAEKNDQLPSDDSAVQFLMAVGPSAMVKELPKSCKNVNLTPEQEALAREVIHSALKERIKIKAELRLAKLDYLHSIASDKSISAEAETSGAMITSSIAKLISNRVAATNTIIYSVLKPEQRRDATKCMLALKAKFKARKLARLCKALPTPEESAVEQEESAEQEESTFPDTP